MRKEIKCRKCETENVIIENKLFFSEDKKQHNVLCSVCKNQLSTEITDGWFFVQSKEQFLLEEKIEEQKQKIVYA